LENGSFLIVSERAEAYNARLMHIIFKNGLAAAKKNIGPGLLLQSFALALVLLYYFHTPTRQLLLKIPEFKQQTGLLFPVCATALCGGLLPFIFLLVRHELPRGRRMAQLVFLLGFWAINGLIVDLLYTAQAQMFGDQFTVLTVAKKVCVDQFVFNPLWAVPWSFIALHWKNCDFSFRKTGATLSRQLFLTEWASILLSTWAVWIPAVSIVYSLPLALQFPLFNIVLCFWSLLLTTLTHGGKS
jgi:hypothetical protein